MITQLLTEKPGIVSLDEAEQLLGPSLPLIRDCFDQMVAEVADVLARDPEFAATLTTRSKASIVNDHVVRAIETRFAGKPGIRITRDRGFLVLIVNDRIVVRFKKLDRKLRSRNILTNQQRALLRQENLPGLPPDCTVVVAGYRLGASGLQILDSHVVCPVGSRNKWDIPLNAPAERLPAAVADLEDGLATPVLKPIPRTTANAEGA